MATLSGVVTKFYEEYSSSTPKKLKIIDAYLTYIFFTGVVQFVYCAMVGTFPFNAFLSGFISSVASFVLAVCLRLQVKLLKIFVGSNRSSRSAKWFYLSVWDKFV